MGALIPAPPKGTPIKDLERCWLDTACLYEEFDETAMADTDWDQMGKELWERRAEWSPYFRHSLPSSDFNPGTTGSGLNWTKDLPLIVKQALEGLKGDYSSVIAKHTSAFQPRR